jgi:hypothetical protein
MFTSRPRQPLPPRMLRTHQQRMIGHLSPSHPINVRCPAVMSGNSPAAVTMEGLRSREATSTLVPTRPAPRSHQVILIHISHSPLLTPGISSVSDESDSSMVTPADTLLFVRFTSADSMIPFTHAQDESDSDTPCTFLQHPDLLGKEKRRRQGGSRRKGATHQGGNQSAFSVPSLDFDGCLGGF